MSALNPEQRRAAHALGAVKRVEALDEPVKRKYRSYAERVGTAILMNGLGQALATELAAAGLDRDNPHRLLYMNLQSWLCRPGGILDGTELLDVLITVDQTTYLRAQAEALSWLTWHKKLCRAFLPRGAADEEQ